jgi:flavin-dependent dehydrogenase
MDAAEIAASTLDEAFRASDWSERRLRQYQERWMRAFGRDFHWSRIMARCCARYPGLLDASAAAVCRRGAEFLTVWAEIMTGVRPKRSLLTPRLVVPLAAAVVRQWWMRGRPSRPEPVPFRPGGSR